MKKIAKMAVGISAVAMAASAFAGGPEMAPTITGFNIGLGMGYNSYQMNFRMTEPDPGTDILFDYGATTGAHFGPLGELGFTYQLTDSPMFIGLRGFWEYDNYQRVAAVGDYGANVAFRSHLAAMFVVGAVLNAENAVYLEAGYTALWAKSNMYASSAPGSTDPITNKFTLNGGIAGVGWRHYFVPNVYLDLGYNFALYADGGGSIAMPITATAPAGGTLSSVRKIQINGVTATLNYLFNF